MMAETNGDTIDQALSQMDATLYQQLSGLSLVQQARLNRLQRQLKAQTIRYGPGDERVLATQAEIDIGQAVMCRVSVARSQTTTVTPQAPANGWVIHGYCEKMRSFNRFPSFPSYWSTQKRSGFGITAIRSPIKMVTFC
jgi:hypothetical protein